MKDFVSKTRTRQTMKREKRSSQKASRKIPWHQRQWLRLMPAAGLWLLTLLVLHFESFPVVHAGVSVLLPLAGNALFLLAGLVAAGFFLRVARPQLLRNTGLMLLAAIIALLAIVPARALLYAGGRNPAFEHMAVFALPFVLAPMLAATLMSRPTAIAVGGWTALAMGLAAPPEARFTVFATGLCVSVICAYVSNGIRRRSQVLRAGVLSGGIAIFCLIAFTAHAWQDPTWSLRLMLLQALACLASGFISAVIALLLLPLFEFSFNITSDISLLELSDLGHPLLQRLALEAPGTYHHSLVAALLAQAAADEIGANGLLARTAMYFHDIGKLTKPDFFTENIMHKKNPHDDIPPSMSALVIISHVKEGLSLALLHKLPESIRRILSEHHGTSLISYFHHKAKTQLELDLEDKESGNGKNRVSEGDYRYPGPKPASRESAIVCLADAVEAASRSLEKTTPAHIEGLVHTIVDNRIEDNQLDHSDLTLTEIARIKRSFVFSLANMLHGRTPYPKDEPRDKHPAKSAPAKQSPASSPVSASGAAA